MSVPNQNQFPRIALVSVGLGRVQRGFERVISDLFLLTRDQLDVTLFRSAGAVDPREAVPPLLRPLTWLVRHLPLGRWGGGAEYHRDCLAFGLAMLPALIRNRYEIIHCIDPPMALVLVRLQRLFRFRGRILFTEACAMPPQLYPAVDHIHHVAKVLYDGAIGAGVSANRMTLVPLGLHPQRFEIERSREELRRMHGIDEATFVILAVSAVKRDHKRIDHLIEEVSRLSGDVLFWIDGNPEDASIPDLARERLGERCRITHLPTARLPELYRLSDVLIHGSLTEAFGLVVIEALSAGLMVLTHDSPHFQWLIDDPSCLVDMSRPDALAERLAEVQGDRLMLNGKARELGERIRARFDYRNLTRDYLAMYETLSGPRPDRSLTAEVAG